MLSQLTIKNFGLIDTIIIEFAKNLNTLTGETGAGKSIVIDALRYVLGDRINSDQIRNPQEPCTVEAIFDLSANTLSHDPLFCEFVSSDDPVTFIIQRTYLPDGKNKIKINGTGITVTQLKEIGNHLVDFHGPHDHQSLLAQESHIAIIDRLSNLTDIQKLYHQEYIQYVSLQEKLNELRHAASSRERELDLLIHQIKELERVPLEPTKYHEYRQQQTMLNNAEKLYEYTNQLIQVLENENTGMNENIHQAFNILSGLNKTDKDTEIFTHHLNQIQSNNDQLLDGLKTYLERLSFEPHEAQKINSFCDTYHDILRKYGPAIEDAQSFYQQAKAKYDFLINLEHSDHALRQNIDTSKEKLETLAKKITVQRKKTGTVLEKTIEKELADLGIKNVQFQCRIETTELNRTGKDTVAFYISPNVGETLKPLAEIVSSGEAARVMLALKKALIDVDPIPVLIFDEIDAQIGGRLGSIIGEKLLQLAQKRQVILITHLPQIAAFAHAHFKVIKEIKNNRTITRVELLNSDDRVSELTHMLSGDNKTDIARKHAQTMLDQAQKNKLTH